MKLFHWMLMLALLAGAPGAEAAKAKAKTKAKAATGESRVKREAGQANPVTVEADEAAIAAMLPEKPVGLGRPISDRATWDALARDEAAPRVIRAAETLLTTPMPDAPDELYLEYTKNGNRTRYQNVESRRHGRIQTLTEAECLENKGRFLPELEKTLRIICAEKSWVLPAHDKGNLTFTGKRNIIELASSALAAELATMDTLLGEKLSPEVRAMVRQELRRRIFTPFHEMIEGKQPLAWLRMDNNWNAVCLAGVTAAALAEVETREERAFFVHAALEYSWSFLSGFTADGYCSEGVGYWNYGFGHYISLAETIRQATGGKIDLWDRPASYPPATFGAKIQIFDGICPAFADCGVGDRPSRGIMAFVSQRYGLGLKDVAPEPAVSLGSSLFGDMLHDFPYPATPKKAPGNQAMDLGLRTWFDKAGILIGRPAAGAACRMGVALKGGHNAENHNHNDVGSYVVIVDRQPVLLDPGAEVYTKRTFSAQRYESKALNSFGHSVPVVAGKLQSPGAQARGAVLKTEFGDAQDTLALDIKSPYDVASLKALTRTFVYSRAGEGSLTVRDEVDFTKPESFESALVTLGKWKQTGPHTLRVDDGGAAAQVEIDTAGAAFELQSEEIHEDMKTHATPVRIAIRLTQPMQHGSVCVKITPLAGDPTSVRAPAKARGKRSSRKKAQ